MPVFRDAACIFLHPWRAAVNHMKTSLPASGCPCGMIIVLAVMAGGCLSSSAQLFVFDGLESRITKLVRTVHKVTVNRL